MNCVTSSAQSSSLSWLHYFLQNRKARSPLAWNDPIELTDNEITTIARSIRTFQLGESSEGTHLMRLAYRHSKQTGDRQWLKVVQLFIGEEQRHARELGQFMSLHRIPVAQRHWSDTLFRKLRRLANLEMALTVLLTAELVATLYYPALGEATRSPLLNAICAQIYHDELQHVVFQTESLGQLRAQQPAWRNRLVDIAHQMFFWATLLVVWVDHRPVFHASGYRFHHFYDQAFEALHRARRSIHAAQCATASANPPKP